MKNRFHGLFVGLALLSILAQAHASLQDVVGKTDIKSSVVISEYDKWMSKHSSEIRTDYFKSEELPLLLRITAIEGDDQTSNNSNPIFAEDRTRLYGNNVSTTGVIGHFYSDSFSLKGSGYPTLPESDFTNLKNLIKNLPDDHKRLPPADRKVLVTVFEKDGIVRRVYDRANMPDKVIEIIHLSHGSIGSWVPQFKASTEWSIYKNKNHSGDGMLLLSYDKKQIISTGFHGPITFWNPTTQESTKEIDVYQCSYNEPIVFTPDGAVAIVALWRGVALYDTNSWQPFKELIEPMIDRFAPNLTNPQFTPDGKYVIFNSYQTLKMFDLKTWKRVEWLPFIPKDSVSYTPSPDETRAISVSKDGTMVLLNPKKHVIVAKLDEMVNLHRTAFSPDKKLIAISTRSVNYQNERQRERIRVWDLESGKLVKEFKPNELRAFRVDGSLWSPDGKYVLAAAKGNDSWSTVNIGVWSLKSGRHRGDLVGPPSEVTGITFLEGNHQIAAGCADGKIRVWDADRAFHEIRAFEKSLGEKP